MLIKCLPNQISKIGPNGGEYMLNVKRILIILLIMLTGIAILACGSIPDVLAQNTTQATIVGQVNVNGVATNGVSVTCGSGSATTSSSNGVDGVFIISGLPYGTSLPFSASYQGKTYTDTVDPLSTDQQYFELPAVNIDVPAGTATPAPDVTVTPTSTANATATPTPAANATATPTPTVTPTPTPTVTPTPTPTVTLTPTPTPTPTLTPTPTPTPTTEVAPGTSQTPSSPPAQTQSPPDNLQAGNPPTGDLPPGSAPASGTDNFNPMPTEVIKKSIEENMTDTPSLISTEAPTAVPLPSPLPNPQPTTARSPGFAGVLALVCLSGAAYMATRKVR